MNTFQPMCVHDDGTQHPSSDGLLPCPWAPTPGCTLDPACEFGPHDPSAHPCGRKPEAPGTPCRFCGEPTPLDGSACPTCWQAIDVATLRSFCAAQGWDTTVTSDANS